MNKAAVKFNTQDQPEFFRELRSRVNAHFRDNNISKYANLNMKLKTVFMIALYFTPFVLMVTGTVTGTWSVLGLWVLMGIGMSGIGLSIMHDANHGAYSKNKHVNNFLGYLVNFLGAYHQNWKIQHNVLHHSYTNVDGHDEDIAKEGIMRFSPNQEHRSYFKFQVIYAPFLYGLMTLYWLVSKDFEQVVRYKKKDLLAGQGLTFRKAMLEVSFNKAWYVVLFLVLPLIVVSLPWWQIVLGFLAMHFICGLFLALIFQPAHVINETNFYEPDEFGSVENNWAIHQLLTTANFAGNSRIFSWFVGGLNYQIEHHLFPNICHIHYRQLSKIVKATAEEYNIPYHQHRTFFSAVRSHFSHLYKLGTNTYDMKLTAA
ncbi:fatty acid desaturase family protein [Marinoscillum furvescens]|uniref:Linoleoyl-CoA desaturase n=1 Tax=Marinoscillum furvescens DSM 4134 TaxID=1122208 RepID=A0A3D9KWJ4_MARFU|nr:acyl-CoA desaturase [Marinoscillum furvescens]RED92474.1 linoleoyl-CoA desaturase [Marinoscillum furvescens DSM 4134]